MKKHISFKCVPIYQKFIYGQINYKIFLYLSAVVTLLEIKILILNHLL